MSSVYASQPEPVGFARLSPETRRLLGRVGGLMSAATRDTAAMAAKARRGLWAKFLREADPAGVLSERERIARAELLQRAHYAKMSLARWGKTAATATTTAPAPAKPATPTKPVKVKRGKRGAGRDYWAEPDPCQGGADECALEDGDAGGDEDEDDGDTPPRFTA